MSALGCQRTERRIVRRHPVPTVVQKRTVGRRLHIQRGEIFARTDVILVIIGNFRPVCSIIGIIQDRDARR